MKIVIVDKFPILRLGLTLFLKEHFSEATVVELESIGPLKEGTAVDNGDLIILGTVPLSDTDYTDAICEIKLLNPRVKFIVYDEFHEAETILSCIEAGANGYLSKEANLIQLKECIREVLKGKKYIGTEAIVSLLNTERATIVRTTFPRQKVQLTAREYEIAKYLSQGKRTGWIASTLDRKASTISTIKSSIFKKLKIDNIMRLRDEIIRL